MEVFDCARINSLACNLQDSCSFANWPVSDAKEDMNAVKLTYGISPLPAFDITRQLTIPSQYERLLQGAIVDVHLES
ncbi:hypothetical protein JB92DRAFT_2848745 [Gautieria morchelliformis]|nr:hypothetical protein JB92DRAFT_2848745 [Gautieria morchelliformis]